MTNFNERTNTLLYKNIISHTLFSKGWCFCCVWEMSWRRTRLPYWTQVLLTIAALLPHLGWGCSTVDHWGPKALCLPLALNSTSCPQLTQAVCVLVILMFNAHLLPLFFHLFTQVHLLIDGSVEGQYVTLSSFILWLYIYIYIYIYIYKLMKNFVCQKSAQMLTSRAG